MGLEGGFNGFGLWKMKFMNIPLIFAGFVLLGRCLPTTYCTTYYVFKRMKEEQRLFIQQKKIMDAAGIELKTSN
jgi:Na+-transporting NADH:ubiquinone oxidoreductase subunit NqrC